MTRLPATPAAARAQANSPAPAVTAEDVRRRDERALAALHALLVRAAAFELARRAAAFPELRREAPDLAVEAADDALVAILRRLDDFRGESRFTTWAYKFAVLEAAAKARRLLWRGREIPTEPGSWPDTATAPASATAERNELLARLQQAIAEELTPHQRSVLVALALDGVPIDVLAERLGTTRGALYKTLHDARAKLRRAVQEGADDA